MSTNCLNLSNPNIAKLVKEFGEIKTSELIDKYFPNSIPTYEEFVSNKSIKQELGVVPISKVKDEIGVSFKEEISNQQLINLKKAISKTNNKIKDFVYLLFNVKQIGQADLYTWGLRKVKGKLDIQAKLDRAIQNATGTIQSNDKIKELQNKVNQQGIQGDLFSNVNQDNNIRNIINYKNINELTNNLKNNINLDNSLWDNLLTDKTKKELRKLKSKINNLNLTFNTDDINSFDSETNTINLNIYEAQALSNISGLSLNEVVNIIILHEHTHAAFEYVIQNDPNLKTELQKLHKLFLDNVIKYNFNDVLRNNNGLGDLYQKDLYEFIADAFSNPDVINILKQIKIENENLTFYDKFISFVKNILTKIGINLNNTAFDKMQDLLNSFDANDNTLINWQDFDFEVRGITSFGETTEVKSYDTYKQFNIKLNNIFNKFKDVIVNNKQSKEVKELLEERKNILSEFKDYFTDIYENKEITETVSEEVLKKAEIAFEKNLNYFLSIADYKITKINTLKEKYEKLKNEDNKIEYSNILVKLKEEFKFFNNSIIDLNLLITIQKQTTDQKSKNDLTSLITSINSIHNFEKEINKDTAIHEASNTVLSETNKKALDKINEDISRIEEKIKNESNENVKKRLNEGLKIAKNKLDLINQDIRIQNEFGNLKNKKTDTSVFSKLFESASINSQIAVAVVQDILLQTKMSISQAQLNLSNQFQKIYDDYLKEFNIKINDVKSQIWMKQKVDELIKDENGKIIFNEDSTPKTIKVDYILHDISKEFYDELNKLEVKKALIERQYKGADENKKILLNKQLADVNKELYNFKKDYIKGEYTTEYWDKLNEIDNLKSNEGIPLKDIIRDDFDDFQNKKRDLNKRLKSGSKNFNEKIFDDYYLIKESEKKFNDWLNEDKNKELKLKYTDYKNNLKDIFERPDSNENKILAETYIKNVKQKLINDGKSKNEIDKILLKLKHTLYVFTDSDEHLTNIKNINNDIDLIKLKLSVLQSNKKLEQYKNRIEHIINTKVSDIYNILNQFRLADGTIDIDKFNSLENVDEIKKEYINGEFSSDLNNLLYELNNIDNLTNDETELLLNLEELKKLKSSKSDLFEYQESEYYTRDFENGTLVEGIDFRYFGEEKIISPWYSIRTAKESTQSLNPIYFGESKINQNYINKDYDKDIIKFTDNAKIRFRNNSYYSISDRQKTLLDNLTNRYFDAQKKAKKKNGYRLPSIAKDIIDRLLGKELSINSIKTGINEFAFNSINLVDELTGVTDHNFEFYRIPTKYSSQIENNENTDNVIMSLYIYSMATLEEDAFRESYGKVDAVRKSIDPQVQKNTLEQVSNIINTYWFGNKEVAKSSTERVINRAVDHLLSFASFKTFALNVPGQVVNFLNAKVTTYIQRNENRFSLSNWKYGEQIATIAIKDEFKDEFKAGETSFYNQFAQYMGLKEIREKSIESKGLKKWNLKLLSWLKNLTEANIFYSLLFTYSDKIKLNVDGKEIRFHELFEIKTDINGFQFFQIKNEYKKYENKIQELRNQFVKEFRDSYRVINGNFMNLEEAELNRVWYGRLGQFMRKHITPMMVDRFQSKGRYNHYTGDIQQGFYIIFAKALVNDFKAFHFNIMMYGQSWNADEKLAAMKVLKEFSAIMSITGLLFIFGYGDDYDPEDEEEFLNSKWFLNHWIYVMLKTQSEIKSFNPILGTKELLETFDNTTVATSSLKDWRKLIDYTRLWIINDEDAYFKQDSGWWEEGDPKMQKYLYKQVGITGSFENSSQNLINFEFGQRFR